jgi:NTE family protein
MSIGIPLIFSVEKYQDTVYVDGGLINNYPIKLYDDNELDTLLGLKLVTRGEFISHEIDEKIDSFDSYLFHLMTCFLVQKEKETTLSYKYMEHTVCIEAQSVTHTVNFSLSKDDKLRLIEIGYDSACNYFTLKNN